MASSKAPYEALLVIDTWPKSSQDQLPGGQGETAKTQ